MHRFFSLSFGFLFLVLLCFACARPVTPTGGPKDKTPPKVVSEKSTANFQTNFEKQTIELTFDEWIELKNVNKEVFISPPLGKAFNKGRDIKLKGKTVQIKLVEEVQLRDSTTYMIDFGAAVKDFTERNEAKNLRFVFSTGPVLDSLKFGGQIVDAESGEGVKEVTVLLYPAGTMDSVIQKGMPYYFTKTDEQGNYTFQNLSEGVYRIVAIEEKLANQRWEGVNERIAFQEALVALPDSTNSSYDLKLFQEQDTFKKVGQGTPHYGLAWFAFNDNPKPILPPIVPASVEYIEEVSGDTVYIFYKNPPDSAWNIVLGVDTLKVRPSSDSMYFLDNALDFAKPMTVSKSKGRTKAKKTQQRKTPTVQVQPTDTLRFLLSRPLESFDTSKIRLIKDSLDLPLPLIWINTDRPRELNLRMDWAPSALYQIRLFPGAITDWHQQSNRDTMDVRLTVLDSSQISSLSITLDSAKAGMTYWVELSKDGKKVDRSRSVRSDSTTLQFEFLKLPVSAYTIRIIEDRNANGRWDSGSFSEKSQPERIFTEKIESLKPNWSVEKTIVLEEKKQPKSNFKVEKKE